MNFVNNWAQAIIITVIIVTIIEMILPNSNNSKYIKIVSGIFVLITIVSPIINKFSKGNIENDINFESYIKDENSEAIQTNAMLSNDESIKRMYEENLKIDIKTKISQKGYIVGDINLEILNNDEYTLNKIDIYIKERSNQNPENKEQNVTTIVENIENIKINIGGNNNSQKQEKSLLSESEKRKLAEYLSGVYGVNQNNISIK